MRESCADPLGGVDAFGAAAAAFAALAASVEPDQWDAPALGVWTVRSLVGHTSRALTTVTTYLDQPAEAVEVESAACYFARVTRDGTADPTAIAERGRRAGDDLGARPAIAVQELVDRAVGRVAQADLADVITTAAGGMQVSCYLPTRTFELVVHSLDVAAATRQEASLPESLIGQATQLATEVALELGHETAVLMALTGRHTLPPGFSVVP
jgi:uncharacterized protein (TIGR03083 family)